MNAHRVPSWLRQLIRAWMNRPETLADLSLYAKGECGPRSPDGLPHIPTIKAPPGGKS